mgnify:CR=1 FL=1
MDDSYEEEDEYSSHYYDVVHSRKEYVNRHRFTRSNKRSRSNIRRLSTIKYTYNTPDTIPPSFVPYMREQIINGYKFLSHNGLGPDVCNVQIYQNTFSITVKFEEEDSNIEDIALKIGDAVAKLHTLGKGHGNLCRSNVRIRGNIVHFLSPEYMYDIASLKEDLVAHFYAFNKHDLDLSEEDERKIYLDLDYRLWSEDIYGRYRCQRSSATVPRSGQVMLLIM